MIPPTAQFSAGSSHFATSLCDLWPVCTATCVPTRHTETCHVSR